MQIELRNCELTIGHIGTRAEIAIQIIDGIATSFRDAMIALADSLRPVMEKMTAFAMAVCQDVYRAFEEAAEKYAGGIATLPSRDLAGL